MYMLDILRAKRDEVYAAARRHKAERLWVFGSCARKEETPSSDIDILAKFREDIGFLEHHQFERELSHILGGRAEVTGSEVLCREPRFAACVCREAVAL